MADTLSDSPIYQQMLSYLQNRKAVPKQSKEFVNDVRPAKQDILSLIEEQFTVQSLESKGAVDQFTAAHKKLRPGTSTTTPAFTMVSTASSANLVGQSHGGATAATETLLLLDLATRAPQRR